MREQKRAVARASVADIRPESLTVRSLAAWPPLTLAADITVLWTNDKSSQSCTASPIDGDRQHFCFQAARPPSSRFKISSDSYIDIDSLFSCSALRAFRSLLRRSRRREHGWLGQGIGSSVVAAPFPVTLTMCVTVKANVQNEERMSTFVPTPAVVVAFARYVTKTWRLKKRTSGELWGRPGRRPRTLEFEGDAQGPCMSSVQLLSARRCTFGALLSTAHPAVHLEMRRWTMVAPTKKQNAKRRSPLHKKDLLRIGANVGSEMFSRSAVWRRIEWVHQSADNKTTT